MMVSVVSLLRPTKIVGVDHLDELAERIAGGAAVSPEEVLAVLDRCRATEDDLQRAVDRLSRVIELRRVVATGAATEKRLAAIEAELDAGYGAVAAAKEKLTALVNRVSEEHMTLRHRVDAIDHARRALMEPDNLPPLLAERLLATSRAAAAASDTLAAAGRDLADRRSRLRQAEEALPRAEREASLRRDDDARMEAERWRNAVQARRGLVVEGEHAVAEAKKAQAAAAAECAAAQRAAEAAAVAG